MGQSCVKSTDDDSHHPTRDGLTKNRSVMKFDKSARSADSTRTLKNVWRVGRSKHSRFDSSDILDNEYKYISPFNGYKDSYHSSHETEIRRKSHKNSAEPKHGRHQKPHNKSMESRQQRTQQLVNINSGVKFTIQRIAIQSEQMENCADDGMSSDVRKMKYRSGNVEEDSGFFDNTPELLQRRPAQNSQLNSISESNDEQNHHHHHHQNRRESPFSSRDNISKARNMTSSLTRDMTSPVADSRCFSCCRCCRHNDVRENPYVSSHVLRQYPFYPQLISRSDHHQHHHHHHQQQQQQRYQLLRNQISTYEVSNDHHHHGDSDHHHHHHHHCRRRHRYGHHHRHNHQTDRCNKTNLLSLSESRNSSKLVNHTLATPSTLSADSQTIFSSSSHDERTHLNLNATSLTAATTMATSSKRNKCNSSRYRHSDSNQTKLLGRVDGDKDMRQLYNISHRHHRRHHNFHASSSSSSSSSPRSSRYGSMIRRQTRARRSFGVGESSTGSTLGKKLNNKDTTKTESPMTDLNRKSNESSESRKFIRPDVFYSNDEMVELVKKSFLANGVTYCNKLKNCN